MSQNGYEIGNGFYWRRSVTSRLTFSLQLYSPPHNGDSDKQELHFIGTHLMGQTHCEFDPKRDGTSDKGDTFIKSIYDYFCIIFSSQKAICNAVKVRDHNLQRVVLVLAF